MTLKALLITSLTLMIWSELTAQDYCIPHRLTDNYYFRSRDIQLETDVIYGYAEDYRGNIISVDLDIFYPKLNIDTLGKNPLIVLLHGSYGKEDNTQVHKYCPLLAQRGFVVATLNYRDAYQGNLSDNKRDSTLAMTTYRCLQDINAAIRYLVNNSTEYGIDTNAIIIGGQSAGAMLSLTLAYMDQQDFDELFPWIEKRLGRLDNSTNDIKTDFNISAVIDMWGQILDTSYISEEEARAIPVIIFHGTADNSLSTYDKSVLIANRFQELDGCYQLHTRTGAGHGEDMSKYYIAAKTGCFIKRILCESCNSLEREIDNDDLTCDNGLTIDKPHFERSSVKVDQSLLTHNVGNYRFVDEDGNKQMLLIYLEGDHLFLQDRNSRFKVELFAESEDDFFIKEDNLQISFNRIKNDKVVGLTLFIDAKEFHAKRKKSKIVTESEILID